MAEYIEREALLNNRPEGRNVLQIGKEEYNKGWNDCRNAFVECICEEQSADVAPVRHGRWILEAHDERVNYRWNVTAECSECCNEKKEIWAGFFPNVPDWLARDVALESAKSVKLSNYCPNCGCRMDLED